jgi:ubiquinone/menaquinone biosynthesis C-methylase UbiE
VKVLYSADHDGLDRSCAPFRASIEPLLRVLASAPRVRSTTDADDVIQQYLQVCRWPFRQLEYSFALSALFKHLKPGNSYLDAGCGCTPLAHAVAARSVRAHACDRDPDVIDDLQRLAPNELYGSAVSYTVQDLTSVGYPDGTFDAISCISVLEHIPPPHDQRALTELLRILKPGGILVLTVDFAPASAIPGVTDAQRNLQRMMALVSRGEFRQIWTGIGHRMNAMKDAGFGRQFHPRSAHQCFQVPHLLDDVLPVLIDQATVDAPDNGVDLDAVTPADARRFWDLEPGLFQLQHSRPVLPAACIIRKNQLH